MNDLKTGIEIGKKLVKEEKNNTLKIVGIVCGAVAAIAAIGAAVYGIVRLVDRIRYADFQDDFDYLLDDEDDYDFED